MAVDWVRKVTGIKIETGRENVKPKMEDQKMTLIKWKKNDLYPGSAFPDIFEDFFAGNPFALRNQAVLPAVNISEDDKEFHLEVSAPGFEKGEFEVEVENDVLTISADHKSEEKEEKKNYSRREFRSRSFRRSFTLPEHVVSDKIGAKYENGILILDLPKQEISVPQAAKKIAIS